MAIVLLKKSTGKNSTVAYNDNALIALKCGLATRVLVASVD